jgi:uridine kinase
VKQQLEPIVQRINSLAKHPLLVAVDGCGGAGKSTTAQALKTLVEPRHSVQIVSLDHFYTPISAAQQTLVKDKQARDHYFNSKAFRQHILFPLSMGQDITYQRQDWLTATSSGAYQIRAQGVIIIDGVYAFSRCLRDIYRLSIYVDTLPLMRLQRLQARIQPSVDWISHWCATEEWHHRYEQTRLAVNYLIYG